MFEVLNNLSVMILEVICNRIYFGALFNNKKTIGKRESFVSLLIHIASFFLVEIILRDYFVLRIIVIVLVMTTIMYFLKESKTWRLLVASISFMIIMLILDFATFCTINALFEQFDANDIGNTLSGRLLVIIEKTLLLLIVLSLKMRSDKKAGRGLIETEWIRFAFFPTFTIIVALSLAVAFSGIQDKKQANVLYIIAFGMVVMNIFIYFLINDIIGREVEIKEKEAEYAQFRNQINIYNTIYESLERQKERAHEFKNRILCVDSLAKEKKFEELERYVSDISKSLYLERNVIDTNNVIVNTILNEKYAEMMDKGIVFAFRINDLSEVPIGNEDLVVILSNLLNNAIEACEKCEGKRTIKFKFMIKNDMLILSVRNTSPGLVTVREGQIETSKHIRTDEHGIGIRNIKKSIEKYGGTYSIKSLNNEFYFAIIFPLNGGM